MEYRRFGDRIVARVDRGEELIEALLSIARHERLDCAAVSGLGAADEMTVGVYSVAAQTFHATEHEGECELASILGTITRQSGAPCAHIHVAAFAQDGRALGGHLKRARISATCELVLTQIDGAVGRAHDDTTGLELMSFD